VKLNQYWRFKMQIKAKLYSLCMTTVIFACSAATSWAAATVCNTKTVGTGANTTVIAVASNFYGPAQDLVTAFQSTAAGANTAITICQNSTAHLLAEINSGTELPASAFPTDPGFPRYGLFLAANAAAPVGLQSSTGNTAYSYANGIPVLFSVSSTISNVGNLMPSLAPTTATAASITGVVTSSQAISTSNAQTLAVADPTTAPYGLAATTILKDMALLPTATGFTVPTWMYGPLYSNIDLTYASIINNVNKSGFVSKAQICSILGSTRYIEFPGYQIDQEAILLKTLIGSPNATAAGLDSYVQGQIDSGDWNTFLLNHCYGTL
jgi:ABC-type molybdate transport system substrate-binding protein